MTMEDYARLERVQGYYGGQMASFEAVFSPRGTDGQPMPLFDRDTGRIDPFVEKAWERYDINRLLKTNWPKLGPKLQGKLHIIVGTQDTFHLEAGVYLLRQMLKDLGAVGESTKTTTSEKSSLIGGGYIEFIDGRDHFDLYGGGLAERIAKEMFEVARPRARKTTTLRKAAQVGCLERALVPPLGGQVRFLNEHIV
jgi:hypothetical protein